MVSELKRAENCFFREKNAVRMCEPLGKILDLPEGVIALKSLRNTLLGFSYKDIYKIDRASLKSEKIGSYLNATTKNTFVYQGTSNCLYPDIFIKDNLIYIPFETNSQIELRILEKSSGNIVKSFSFGSGTKPKVISNERFTFIVFLRRDSCQFEIYQINNLNINELPTRRTYTTSCITDFLLEITESDLKIVYRDDSENDLILNYRIDRNIFESEENTVIPTYKTNKTNVPSNFYRFNLWTTFEYDEETYSIYWNNFRGYFILNSAGNIVGKLLGKISPNINEDGVEFNGKPFIDGDRIFIPMLVQSTQRLIDQDELESPYGLRIMEIGIEKEKIVTQTDESFNQGFLGSPIVKLFDANQFSEFNFCEAPQISIVDNENLQANEIKKEEINLDWFSEEQSETFDIRNRNFSSSDYNIQSVKPAPIGSVQGGSTSEDRADLHDITGFTNQTGILANVELGVTRDSFIRDYGSTIRISLYANNDPLPASLNNTIGVIKKNGQIVAIGHANLNSSQFNLTLDVLKNHNGLFSDYSISYDDLADNIENFTFEFYTNSWGSGFNLLAPFYIDSSLDATARAFLDGFFERNESSITNEISGDDYTLSQLKVEGGQLIVGIKGSSRPAVDFASRFTLVSINREVFSPEETFNITNTTTTEEGEENERIFKFATTETELPSGRYTFKIILSSMEGWRYTPDAGQLNFGLGNENYTISKIELQKNTTANVVELMVSFEGQSPPPAPDANSFYPFFFEADEIGSKASTEFAYHSIRNNVVTFRSNKTIPDVGLVDTQDETLNLSILSGVPASSAVISENSTYTYLVVYKWVDSNGKVHRSRHSNPETVTLKNQKIGEGSTPAIVRINISCLNLTEKENVIVEVYRSQFIPSTNISEALFNKVGEVNNDKSCDQFEYTDNVPDSDLREQFFNFREDQPNGANILISHDRRIFIAEGNELKYSEQLTPEREDAFAFKLDSVQLFDGIILGIAQLDEKLIVFTDKKNYFFVVGETPQEVQSLEGLILTGSSALISYPRGIIFQSNEGIYNLDRGTGIIYIGENIRSLEKSLIVDASLDIQNQEIFLRQDNGNILVYNYLYKKWSINGQTMLSSILFNGEKLFLDVGSRLLSNQEEGQPRASTIETGNFNLDQIQDFISIRRAFLMGDFGNWTRMRIQVAYNLEEAFTDDFITDREPQAGYAEKGLNYGENTPLAPNAPERFQIMFEPSRRKIYAMRVRLTLASKNAKLSNVSFEVYVDRVANKTLPSQRL